MTLVHGQRVLVEEETLPAGGRVNLVFQSLSKKSRKRIIWRSILEDNVQLIKYFLSSNLEKSEIIDWSGRTILDIAASQGAADVVDAILQHPGENVELENALKLVIVNWFPEEKEKRERIVQALLSAGAKPDVALFAAEARGLDADVQELLRAPHLDQGSQR